MFDFLTAALVRRMLLSICVASSLAFLVLTGLVIKDKLRTTDFNLTVKLQDRVPTRIDPKLVDIVDLGSMEVQTVLICIALFFIPVPKKVKGLLAIAYIVGLAVTLLGKNFLPQPAPPFLFQRGAMGIAFPSSHVQVDASYPSGHTYRVIFLSALLTGSWLVSKKHNLIHLGIAVLSILFATLVLLGLIVLGKHWSTDVFGGIFLSISLVSATLLVFHHQPHKSL